MTNISVSTKDWLMIEAALRRSGSDELSLVEAESGDGVSIVAGPERVVLCLCLRADRTWQASDGAKAVLATGSLGSVLAAVLPPASEGRHCGARATILPAFAKSSAERQQPAALA